MVNTCVVLGCGFSYCRRKIQRKEHVSMHRFPSRKDLREAWVKAVRRENWQPTPASGVCSQHFTSVDFDLTGQTRRLREGVIPSVFPARPSSSQKGPTSLRRHPNSVKPSDQRPKRKVIPNRNDLDELCHLRKVTNDHSYTLTENKTDTVKSEVSERALVLEPKIEIMIDEEDSSAGKLMLKISKLKAKGHIDKHTLGILNTNFSEDMLDEVYKACGEQNGDYSEILKMFAITLHFYCPAAFEHLRQTLDKTLPQVGTVRKWCTSSVGDPGFTEESLKFLEEHVESSSNLVYVSLIFDTMSLERGSSWDGNKFVGCVNLGDGVCVSDYEEAREVVVLMVVAVNASWKIPIGYYLVNELSASVKANLVREAILRLQTINLNVLAVMFKGDNSNLVTGEKLGCNFIAESLDCSFTVGGQTIQFMLDPFHMISLVRSLLCEFKILKDQNGDAIDCRYIELLQDYQQHKRVSPGKTKRKSVQSLEENIALRVPSISIGKALQDVCIERKLPRFKGALPTAEFCIFFDKLFALFTSKSRLAKGYKSVLSTRNKAASFSLLDYAESYILGMKDEYDRPLYHTSRRIAIIGFLSLCRGIRSIFMEVIETKQMNYLATYRFSVENLEVFFDRIQNKLESSHPTALQFKEAYRELITRVVKGQDSETSDEENHAMEF